MMQLTKQLAGFARNIITGYPSWLQAAQGKHSVSKSQKNMRKLNQNCWSLWKSSEVIYTVINYLWVNISVTVINSALWLKGLDVKGRWKPWQKGILIATTAFLSLAERLLNRQGYDFVLGGRFSTNCVENLFSVVRLKFKVPTVLQWKNCLKAIILSQYARSVPSSSYAQEVCDNFNDSLTMKALDFLGKSNYCKI